MQAPSPSSFLITPQQTLSAARQAGLEDERLALSGIAVLTFSKGVVDRLAERCSLTDVEWLSPLHHPYAAPHVVKRGTFQKLGVTVLVPPMGASPLACSSSRPSNWSEGGIQPGCAKRATGLPVASRQRSCSRPRSGCGGRGCGRHG
jgi:hypothetical protein